MKQFTLSKILHSQRKTCPKNLFSLIPHTSYFIFFFLLALPLNAQSYNLAELASLMQQNNPDIRAAEEEAKRATLDYKDSLAGFQPKIDFQLSATYMVNPPVGSVYVNVDNILDAVKWPSGLKPAKTGQHIKVYDGMENTIYNFSLSLEQPIFTWGKIYNSIKLYDEIAKIQSLKLEYIRKQLESELESRIVALKFLNDINLLLDEETAYANEMVTFSENAEKSGMLLHQDVVEARIQAKELDIAKQGVNEQIENQLIELRRITGISDLNLEQIDYKINGNVLQSVISKDRTEMLDRALSAEQDSIRMTMQAKTVNDIATKISKESVYWKPDVGFQMSLGYGGSRFPFIEKNWNRKDDYSINLSLGIKTTVWDGGKKLNAIARSQSNADSAQVNVDATRATIRKTLQEQWNTADVCSMKIEYQNLKIETAENKIEQKKILYENGYGSKTDLLSAQIEKCNEQIEMLQQEMSRVIAILTIKFLCK